MTNDPINHPSHYQTADGIEAVDVIEHYGLGYHVGNAWKYITRAGKKNPAKEAEDLAKARWFLTRWLEGMEQNRPGVHVPCADDGDGRGMNWRSPEQIVNAFGFVGFRREAALDILDAAGFADEGAVDTLFPSFEESMIGKAVGWLDREIERLTVAALPRAHMASA